MSEFSSSRLLRLASMAMYSLGSVRRAVVLVKMSNESGTPLRGTNRMEKELAGAGGEGDKNDRWQRPEWSARRPTCIYNVFTVFEKFSFVIEGLLLFFVVDHSSIRKLLYFTLLIMQAMILSELIFYYFFRNSS